MKLTSVQRVDEAPSNLTNKELVSHICHYFPNLHGPLRMMFERFAHNASAINNDFETDTKNMDLGSCPHCGSLLEVNITI
jgi:hypothetical protein